MNPSSTCRLANRRMLFQSLSSFRSSTRSSHLPQRFTPRPQQYRNASRYSKGAADASYHDLPVRNRLDDIASRAAAKEERKKDVRYMQLCALGAVVGMAGTFFFTVLFPADEMQKLAEQRRREREARMQASGTSADAPPAGDGKEFQGKPVVVIAGGQKVIAKDEMTGKEIELVETGTSTIPHFPKTIQIPSSTDGPADENEYTLLGLGIRTVSFLGIQVYVVGFYIQTKSLARLQARLVKYINPLGSALIAGEKDELRKALLDGEKSYELWDKLLSEEDLGLKTAFRVVPTRNTDFGHLRDGWVRGITSRTQDAQKKGDQQFSDDSFGLAMKDFKALMQGKGKAPTGSILLLTRDANGTLGIRYQDLKGKLEDFGTLTDERIARLVWLGYLGGNNVSSENARKGIVDGVMDIVERPIGSVETMVS